EPTNHLDIESTEWLEDFLRDYKGAFVIISHDRYFLDRVTNKTFELENNKLTVYNGNYSTYVKLKEEREKTLIRNYENTTREIHRIEGIIEQQRRWNREKNIKTAESKQKQIERLEKDLEKPEIYNENIKFNFKAKNMGGTEVLRCNGLKMAFDEKLLFENTDVEVNRGERVFLLGANGCGKTTLFKIIMGELHPVAGTTKIGANIQVGYFDQKQKNLSLEKDAIDEVWDAYPSMTQTEVRNAMAAFLFKNDDVFTPVSSLSGGERARVALIKLMLSGSNFLILDEPTNHLDIKSREALEDALLGYVGTMLVVSHDRYFINKLATKIYYMESRGVKKYDGDYTYFSQIKKMAYTEVYVKVKQTNAKLDYKAQKQYEAEIRKLKNAVTKTEEEIELTEQTVADYEEQLMLPENATDFQKSMEITKNLEENKAMLEELYQSWEELSAQLAEKQNQ
ncbi:MAG: ABC-F family ATP-binding cassette domain-containing protein, partial [Clostridia bacterium]|nr:ABC-F family ATP-binding cassette domain-containing protein [Clostridia bacterium]